MLPFLDEFEKNSASSEFSDVETCILLNSHNPSTSRGYGGNEILAFAHENSGSYSTSDR